MNISLKEFFLNGNFGKIKIGITCTELTKQIGSTDVMGYGKNKWNSIWKYGPLEIAFTKGYLSMIIFRFDENEVLSDSFNFIGYFPTKKSNLEELINYLNYEEITYTYKKNYSDENVTQILSESGNSISFVNDFIYKIISY